MTRQLGKLATWLGAAMLFVLARHAVAQYAVEVVSYDPGTTPAIDFESLLPYNLTSSALGEPSRYIDDTFASGVVSAFNAPFKRHQLLSVGETGHVTLRLSHYAVPQPGGKEIGVFAHAGLIDFAYPNGMATLPATAYSVDDAFVEMSADGFAWFAVGNHTFNLPTNGYQDVTLPYNVSRGGDPSDFYEPFVGTLSDFDGLPFYDADGPDVLEVLAGTGGGNWLDIPMGLAKVGYIRFSVADNSLPQAINFELDAVTIARTAIGARTPEPTSLGLISLAVAFGTLRRRRRIADLAS